MKSNKVKNLVLDHIIEILLILLVVVMACVSSNFFTVTNIMNILRNQALKGVIAFGMTMVIISGQIDLSIGSQVALAGVIVARFCRDLPGQTGCSVTAACLIGIVISVIMILLMAVGIVGEFSSDYYSDYGNNYDYYQDACRFFFGF